ncbi:MAG: ATP-binding protein [Spirochaetales bacterium]|nr:ATP-binding protein [Spirochaetales bacterium]
MKSLPIGISTFRTIIENELTYADKTGGFLDLVKQPGRYFLSRPRRFGKSLLVDTFQELFEGNQELFRGLEIAAHWDWSKHYPVVKIDFAGGLLRNRQDMEDKLYPDLARIGNQHQITLSNSGISNRLKELILALRDKTKMPVVLLVDEYNKPLLDNIEDPGQTIVMRDLLKELYSIVKDVDDSLQFVFFAGVSKFSKVSIFSGVNNLKDLSLDPKYATLCGYTQHDLETVFAEHLQGVDWPQLRHWYNGYNFLGEAVYNPFDILLFISEGRRFRSFWFETGTPTFLIKVLQKNRTFLPDLENLELTDEQLGTFEIERIPPGVLLFQSGYLTIDKSFQKMGLPAYRLRVPNFEVRSALSNALFTGYTDISDQRLKFQTGAYDALVSADLLALEGAITRLFASIPGRNFTNNDIAEYEGYYGSVLYSFFVSLSCTVIPEDTNNHGQADLTIRLENKVYVMEIKVIPTDATLGTTNTALDQVHSRNYAQKYQGEPGVQVFELGLVFSQEKRNLVQFDYERA